MSLLVVEDHSSFAQCCLVQALWFCFVLVTLYELLYYQSTLLVRLEQETVFVVWLKTKELLLLNDSNIINAKR